jgi:hypothetical protein
LWKGLKNSMNDQRILRYFLGGNSYRGFHSLYDGFVPLSDGCFLWILKGLPGCGKSSFMRAVGEAAEKAGLGVEYALCSGDPASLDGVYIPALRTAYMDGTAPHTTDPHLAGADSAYIDLGAFCDYRAASGSRAELTELYARCSAYQQKASSLFAAAGHLKLGWLGGFVTPSERDAAIRRVSGAAQRDFGKRRNGGGRASRRFLSAHTCRGLAVLPETARALCGRFYVLENRLRLGTPALAQLARSAAEAGCDAIICPDPLIPEMPEALLLPTLALGFVCSDSPLAAIPRARRIRLDALADAARMQETRPERRRCEKNCAALLGDAYTALAEAKRLHDQIENIFNPLMDFGGVTALAAQHIAALGLA